MTRRNESKTAAEAWADLGALLRQTFLTRSFVIYCSVIWAAFAAGAFAYLVYVGDWLDATAVVLIVPAAVFAARLWWRIVSAEEGKR